MTYKQYLEWRMFEGLEPFETERADYRTGFLIQLLTNIHRPKGAKRKTIKECVPKFGDQAGQSGPTASNWQHMKLLAIQLTAASGQGDKRRKRGS